MPEMDIIWNMPLIEIRDLGTVIDPRPAAVVTGSRAWNAVGPMLDLSIVLQAEPRTADHKFLSTMAGGLAQNPQVEVVYGIGGGLAADVAKYVAHKNNLPCILIPTALSVDGFFTSLVAVRQGGTVHYETTGPAEKVIIDWDVVASAPRHIRGTGIAEILSMTTGLLDWQYAAREQKNTPETRFQPWAASIAAAVAQQAYKIADSVGKGKVEALRNLLDLICVEVQLTNQLGHNRPQEGSEQYFAYAIEPRVARGSGIPYADLVGPGILIAAALHGQKIDPIRDTLVSAGVRLDELPQDAIRETLEMLPGYVRQHNLPYSIVHDLDMSSEETLAALARTGLYE